MVKKLHAPASDMRGLSRLTIDAIAAVVDLVEAMHYNIASVPGIHGETKPGQTTGITGLVYRSISGAIGWVGHRLDWLLAKLNPVPLDAQALAAAIPHAGGKLVVLVHGLCMNDVQWNRQWRDQGDGIVPLASALGHHQDPSLALTFPESRQWIGYGMNHLDLLNRREVYARISQWLASPG